MKNENTVPEPKLSSERKRYLMFRYFELYDSREMIEETKRRDNQSPSDNKRI